MSGTKMPMTPSATDRLPTAMRINLKICWGMTRPKNVPGSYQTPAGDNAARSVPRADALVRFGASGALAFKSIFPALQRVAAAGQLDMPVLGVARKEWTREDLIARARASIEAAGVFQPEAFDRLSANLHYVKGDYASPSTYAEIRARLGSARRPLHYLAIPPSMFEHVIRGLAEHGCANGGRVVVEKPFGRDLASAQALDRVLHQYFRERDIFRIDHYLGKEPVQNLLYFRFANTFL